MFRTNSIFYKIFRVLFIFILLILLLLAYFLGDLILANKNENLHKANILRLQHAADNLDLTFALLESNMSSRMWDRDFITYGLNPNKADAYRDTRMLKALYNEAHGKPLIRSAYLYSVNTDVVLTSENSLIDIKSRQVQFILQQYLLLDLSERPISELRTRSIVQMFDDRLFLFVDYYLTQRLSTLIYEIDLSTLFQSISGPNEESSIFIFDADGNAIFNSVKLYPINAQDLARSHLFLTASETGTQQKQNATYYEYISPITGWYYVSAINRELSPISMISIVLLILPLLLLVLLLSVFFSIYITASIYRPINRLVSLFAGTGLEYRQAQDRKRKNEFDYLEEAYTLVLNEKEKVATFIQDFCGRLLEDILKRILNGKIYEEEQLIATLNGLDQPFDVHDRFVVMIGRVYVPEERPIPSMENDLYTISIYQIIQTVSNDDYTIIPLYMEKDEIVVVISAKRDISTVKVQTFLHNIKQTVHSRVQEFPYTLTWGTGKVYNHLQGLLWSYKDAQEDFSRSLEKNTEEATQENANFDSYLKEQMQNFVADIGNCSRHEADSKLYRLILDAVERADGLVQAKEWLEIISSALMGKLIELHVTEERMAGISQYAGELACANTTEALPKIMENLCKEALKLIFTQIRSSKYTNVEAAKAYISLFYSESTLSQNDVAAHIGISTSYLSDQFRAITHQSFPQYLNMYRVEQAKRLLSSTSISIQEIGVRCGFSSSQNFIRVFKKYTMLTPGHFRR